MRRAFSFLFFVLIALFVLPIQAGSPVEFSEIVVSGAAAEDDSLVILQSQMSVAEFKVTELMPVGGSFKSAKQRQAYYKALSDLSKARAAYFQRLARYVDGEDAASYRRMARVHRNAQRRRQKRYFASLSEGITDFEF